MSFAERGQRWGDNIDRGIENVGRRYSNTKNAIHDSASRGYTNTKQRAYAAYNVVNQTKRRIAIVFTLLLAIALTYIIIIYIPASSIGALAGVATFVVVVWMIPTATLMWYAYRKTDKLTNRLTSANNRLVDVSRLSKNLDERQKKLVSNEWKQDEREARLNAQEDFHEHVLE